MCVLFKMMNLSGDFGSEAHIYITVGSTVVHKALSTVKAEKAGTPNPLYIEKPLIWRMLCVVEVVVAVKYSAEMTSQNNVASSPYAPCGYHSNLIHKCIC